MDEPQTYTLREVMTMGFEAYHLAEGGVWWLCHGDCAMCSDPASGVRTLITDPAAMPDGPWWPTGWGERELARQAGADSA